MDVPHLLIRGSRVRPPRGPPGFRHKKRRVSYYPAFYLLFDSQIDSHGVGYPVTRLSIRSAAFCRAGFITGEYRFIVNPIWLCPNTSIMSLGFTFSASNNDAVVCRRSWNRSRGNPSLFSKVWKSLVRLCLFIGVPARVVNTRSNSFGSPH